MILYKKPLCAVFCFVVIWKWKDSMGLFERTEKEGVMQRGQCPGSLKVLLPDSILRQQWSGAIGTNFFEEGVFAHGIGLPRSHCPPYTNENIQEIWCRGWDHAESEYSAIAEHKQAHDEAVAKKRRASDSP